MRPPRLVAGKAGVLPRLDREALGALRFRSRFHAAIPDEHLQNRSGVFRLRYPRKEAAGNANAVHYPLDASQRQLPAFRHPLRVHRVDPEFRCAVLAVDAPVSLVLGAAEGHRLSFGDGA